MRNIILSFRNIFNPKENNLFKILSLGIGFAVALALFAKVSFHLNYNMFYPDSDQIYTIFTVSESGDVQADLREYPQVSGAVAPGMKTEIAEVETATRFTHFSRGTFYDKARNKYRASAFILADSCLFDLLPRPMIAGNAKETLSRPMYALVSKSIADKMGGDVMGQQIEIDSYPGKLLTIGGVFEDIPKNAHYRYDVIVSIASITQFTWDGRDNWLGNDRYIAYVKLKKGTNPADLAGAIRRMQVKYQDIEKVKEEYGVDFTYRLSRLDDAITFYPEVKRQVLLMSMLGILLLFVTIMNYILFVISGLVDRGKNVAIYKTHGATVKDISKIMISETLVHFTLALLVAIVLIIVSQDIVEKMFSADIVTLFSLRTSLILLGIVALIFVATTVVPSYMLSSMPVITSIGAFRKNRKAWKLSLLFIQFTASALIITLLTIVTLQYNKMISEDHGFEYRNQIYSFTNNPKNRLAVEEITKLPFVEIAATACTLPMAGDGVSGNNVSIPGETKELFNIADFYYVDERFVPTMGMKIIEGENFTPNSTTDEILVSKQFADYMRAAGWRDKVVDKFVNISEHGLCRIKGVYSDIAVAAFSEGGIGKPSAFFYNPDKSWSIVAKLSEVNSDHITQVQKVFEDVMPEKDVEIRPYNESFIQEYDEQKKFKNSVLIVGIIIFIINMTGLVAYIKNDVQRRSAEIAIRKINGATLADIIIMFGKTILWIAIPALVAGAVAAYFVASQWMKEFSLKITMNPALFIGCALALLIVVMTLTLFNCQKIANANPVNSLKKE